MVPYELEANNLRSLEPNFNLKVSLTIIRCLGTWPPRNRYRCIYMLYSVFSLTVMLGIYLFVQAVNLVVIWGDIEKMVAGGFFLMTTMSHALKERIQSLLDLLESDMFSRDDVKCERILSWYSWAGIYHHVAYQCLSTITIIGWTISPVANLIAGQGRILPLDGWYPYNVTRSPGFELTWAHQSFAAYTGATHNIAMDTLVTGMITVACCQLELLKHNVRNIGNDVSDAGSTDYERMNVLKTDGNDERINKQLKRCIEHHNAIINFAKEIEAIFSITIFVQFMVNSLIICLTAFHITQMKVFVPAELMGMTVYICTMIYQIFIYCWHGNEIFLQSQSVMMAAYDGNWWRCGERYKRALRLISVRASRPVILTAGHFLTLSLETFTKILKTSYSFFTVLQSSTDN